MLETLKEILLKQLQLIQEEIDKGITIEEASELSRTLGEAVRQLASTSGFKYLPLE